MKIDCERAIKLMKEMGTLMGGDMEAAPFRCFMELCVRGFLVVRPYREDIVSLVSLMVATGLPCFRGETMKLINDRFRPQDSDRNAANYIKRKVEKSYQSKRNEAYDWYQRRNGIL